MSLEKGIDLFNQDKYDEAFEVLNALKDVTDNDILYYYLGKIYYKKQQFGESMNHYLKALEINPSNKEAEIGIRLIRNITEIGNSFYFENPYTDENLIPNL